MFIYIYNFCLFQLKYGWSCWLEVEEEEEEEEED
jgi:hypothetical protein